MAPRSARNLSKALASQRQAEGVVQEAPGWWLRKAQGVSAGGAATGGGEDGWGEGRREGRAEAD